MEKVVAGQTPKAREGSILRLRDHPRSTSIIWSRTRATLKRKKIVLDAGNGTATRSLLSYSQRLGADVIPLYCELDGRFPNHHPDPTVPENLKRTRRSVKRKNKADFGIAF